MIGRTDTIPNTDENSLLDSKDLTIIHVATTHHHMLEIGIMHIWSLFLSWVAQTTAAASCTAVRNISYLPANATRQKSTGFRHN
eukprot:SAG31_NODE_3_length_45830_cov_42.279701_40_plen_84_part_00